MCFAESESSEPEFEDCEEIWDEEEGQVIEELQDVGAPSPVVDSQLQSTSLQSRALSQWFLYFLMFMQAAFKLSDTALSFFLRFFRVFLSVLGQFSTVHVVKEVAENLPSSLQIAWKERKELNFRRYVVCRKCHRIYFFSDCIEGPGISQRSKNCPYVAFPLHPHRHMRNPCGTLLLKTVELAGGCTFFYPFLTYCYVNLDISLQSFLDRPEFYDQCEHWRSRQQRDDVYCDVYDGKIWKDFQQHNGSAFLSEPGNLTVMMNLDFFQPYKHVQYSMGAIYLTILNLPRGIRSNQENTILVGLIPGPHEPRHDLNSFLEPLVDDLLKLWSGVELNVAAVKCRKQIRCALLCVACDLPAGRKVCGFLGHSAHLGCSRCFKTFSGAVGTMNYSGFDRENWTCRLGPRHAQDACSLLNIRTKTELKKSESDLGCRYTVLLKLPYFDAPRMLIVDPMHNLFLGTAKHFLKSMLFGSNLIQETNFTLIQDRVNSLVTPSDIGRIPYKIVSGFSSFTADQWKNWVVYYSLLALRGLLPNDILECWRHFVLACRVLCSKQIAAEQVMLGDALLLYFFKRTERIFGWKYITPNMHMHCHLRSCILDYGPLHGFWLYAFERYNGILGTMPNNNRSIEVQLMRRFLRESQTLSAEYPSQFAEHFLPLFTQRSNSGSFADTLSTEHITLPSADHRTNEALSARIKLPDNCSRYTLNSRELDNLLNLYCKLYSISDSSGITMSKVCMRYSHLFMNEKQLGSFRSRMASSSIVIAEWDTQLFGACSSEAETVADLVNRAVRINYFCKHRVTIEGQNKTHILVNLSWFLYHPRHTELGKPVTIWYDSLFEPCGLHTIIPIQFIKCRSVSQVDKLSDESVLFVIPCIDF